MLNEDPPPTLLLPHNATLPFLCVQTHPLLACGVAAAGEAPNSQSVISGVLQPFVTGCDSCCTTDQYNQSEKIVAEGTTRARVCVMPAELFILAGKQTREQNCTPPSMRLFCLPIYSTFMHFPAHLELCYSSLCSEVGTDQGLVAESPLSFSFSLSFALSPFSFLLSSTPKVVTQGAIVGENSPRIARYPCGAFQVLCNSPPPHPIVFTPPETKKQV